MNADAKRSEAGPSPAGGAATMLGLAAAVAAGGWLLGTAFASTTDTRSAEVTQAGTPASAVLPAATAWKAASARAPGEPVVVEMSNGLAFAPKAIEIRVGQTVRWENTSDVPHTVTADPTATGNPDRVKLPEGAEPFGSELLGAGDTFSHTFTVPGEYRYFCVPHQMADMVGTVIVRP